VPGQVPLAAFIFVEKTTPFGIPAGQVAGVLMLGAAVVVGVAT